MTNEQKIIQPKEVESPTIIVCIDTSSASVAVLRYACYKAKKLGFSVRALAVMESSNLMFGAKTMAHEGRENLEKYLKEAVKKVHKETGLSPDISIREGDISTEIIKEIKSTSNCATLIFGKSHNALSDNVVLPKIIKTIGGKITVPVTIVPENLGDDYLLKLV